MYPLKQPCFDTKVRSCFTVINSTSSFALAQCATMKSHSMTLTIALIGNHAATVEEQWACMTAFARSVHYGIHCLVLVFHSQPHSLCFGTVGVLVRDCFQTKAAVSRARLACWNKACCVGGMSPETWGHGWTWASLLHSQSAHHSSYCTWVLSSARVVAYEVSQMWGCLGLGWWRWRYQWPQER